MDMITRAIRKVSRNGQRNLVIEFSSKTSVESQSLYEIQLNGRPHHFQVESVSEKGISFYDGASVNEEKVFTAVARNVTLEQSALLANVYFNPSLLIGKSISPMLKPKKNVDCFCLVKEA